MKLWINNKQEQGSCHKRNSQGAGSTGCPTFSPSIYLVFFWEADVIFYESGKLKSLNLVLFPDFNTIKRKLCPWLKLNFAPPIIFVKWALNEIGTKIGTEPLFRELTYSKHFCFIPFCFEKLAIERNIFRKKNITIYIFTKT